MDCAEVLPSWLARRGKTFDRYLGKENEIILQLNLYDELLIVFSYILLPLR